VSSTEGPSSNGSSPPEDELQNPTAPKPPMGERRMMGPRPTLGVPGEKSKDFGGSSRRLAGQMRPELLGAITVLALAVISVLCAVVGPKILGRATDTIITGVFSPAGIDYGELNRILALAAGLYLVSSVLQYLQAYLLAGVVQRTMARLRGRVEDKINRLPLRYVDGQARGDLLSRVTNDIDNIAQGVQQSLSQMLTSVLTIVGVTAMMLWISPVLAIVTLVTVPLSILIMKMIAAQSKKRFIAQWMHTGTLNGQVEEVFTGHALVKVFGRQREVEQTFSDKNDELFDAAFGAQFISGTIQPAMMFLGNLNYVAIAVVGGLRVASGNISIGDIQAFIQYSRQFTQPLTQLAAMFNVLQSSVASAERVFELLDAEDEVTESELVPGPAALAGPPMVGGAGAEARGRVEFDHVSFSYSADKPLIQDLSLVAEPGRTVAIVGPTGAGKTTLVNLIMRFYELDGGAITLDGRDIAKMERQELRSNIGMVLQDTWLFSGTIRDNIRFGNLDATEDQILEAAKATYVDRFVHSLPDGYDTVVDDEGTRVSAGEKQLLTIARAFLADPAILILDEATSSVDTRTEVLIQHAMAALRSNRTSFVIAHRLSTIRDADTILVMENGQIVEQGNHEALLSRDGAYARLYNAQFAAPAADVA
jgi:ATP-binding cassette subfamily B multidrug efflux pump